VAFIPKPQNRESTVIFGDGDEAVFGYVGTSVDEDYLLFHLRPTQKMAWKNQIQMSEAENYDKFDGWWKKRFRKDLCLQLSPSPDFPTWLILCDWYGRERTPLMEHFVKCSDLIERNRYLEKKVANFMAAQNRKSMEERKKALHPEGDFLLFEERVKRMIQAGVITPSIQQKDEIGAEE